MFECREAFVIILFLFYFYFISFLFWNVKAGLRALCSFHCSRKYFWESEFNGRNFGGITKSQNKINQPIFSVRQVNTQVVLRPGQTVILGGLMREDVQKIKDKTPIIGDIPLVGKLFRSSSEQHIKKNLLIFVTVWLIDSSGKKIKN